MRPTCAPSSRLELTAHATTARCRKERILGWLTQPYYDKGFAEGFAKGYAEGLAKVRARVVATLFTGILERRFGTVPTDVRQRIFSADVDCIRAWADRMVDAPDLQSIFVSN
jgi:hypothetical protein